MKIHRYGYHRKNGRRLLVDSNVCDIAPGSYFDPKWNADLACLCFMIKGVPGKTTHEFELSFSASELARLIDLALTSASEETSVHALSKGIAAFIQEVLNEKHKKAKDA